MRLYLDNAAITETCRIDTDGSWTATVAGIEPMIYTLRVDQLDAAGKVTSRFETPFKRETQEALAAATARRRRQTAGGRGRRSGARGRYLGRARDRRDRTGCRRDNRTATAKPQPLPKGSLTDGAVVAEPARTRRHGGTFRRLR